LFLKFGLRLLAVTELDFDIKQKNSKRIKMSTPKVLVIGDDTVRESMHQVNIRAVLSKSKI
jgi:hypothetical protein